MKKLKLQTKSELKALTDDQLIDLQLNSYQTINEGLETIEKIKETAEALVTKNNDLDLALKAQSEELTKLKRENTKANKTEKVITEIKSLADTFAAKTKANVSLNKKDITNVNFDNTNEQMMLQGVGKLNSREVKLIDLFSKRTVAANSGGIIRYTDQKTVVRGADNVGKCSPAPATSNIEFVGKSLTLKYIKDSIKVCKNSMLDYSYLAQEVRTLIEENMQQKIEEQLIFGDGVLDNLKGVNSYAQTWSVAPATPAESFANSISFPNLEDVIKVGASQIKKTTLGKVNPKTVLLNDIDFDKLSMQRDAQGRPLYPSLGQGGDKTIGGYNVITSYLIPENTLLMGDFSKAAIYEQSAVNIEMADQHGTDFIDGFVTLLATVNLTLLVRSVDENAFLKVEDIDQAILDLTKI